MAADYGQWFLKQFATVDGYTPNVWKWRVYKRVYGCSPRAVVDGYEKLIAGLNGKQIPTTDQIVHSILAEQRAINNQSRRAEPQPGMICKPGLEKIKQYCDQIRAASKQRAETPEQRRKNLDTMLFNHYALLADHAFLGCPGPGTVGNSTNALCSPNRKRAYACVATAVSPAISHSTRIEYGCQNRHAVQTRMR